MTDRYDRAFMEASLTKVQTLVDSAAQSNDPLVRSNMADLRHAIDFVSDNVSEPIVNELNKPVTQDAYDTLEAEYEALRTNMRALLYDLARRSDRLRSDKDMDHDIAHLCEQRTDEEVTAFVAEYLDYKPEGAATPGTAPAPTPVEDVTFVCSLSRNRRQIIAKPLGGGPSSRLTTNQSIESLRTKLMRRVPAKPGVRRKLVLVNQSGGEFSLPSVR